MARLTLFATAGQSSVSLFALEELVATFEAALATLVADAGSPTEAHVTAVNDAYTAVKVIFTKDFVVDDSRSAVDTDNEKRTAVMAALAQMLSVK